MIESQARAAARTLRSAGWDVQAEQHGTEWRLRAESADGGPPSYGYSHADVKVFVLGGQVKGI